GEYARTRRDLQYADVRVEVGEGLAAVAENGSEKYSGQDYGFSFGIRVIAGDRVAAPGYYGRQIGRADLNNLHALLKEGLDHAHQRALANSRLKQDTKSRFIGLGESLYSTTLAPIEIHRDLVPAEYKVDPRSVDLGEMTRYTG